ncbi:type II toxin-antitoxin system ParD family antitoxin [Desertibaculum subflavum]|uniref:type II toxin-antitoxin system ParD family antitoxin n=1 Tax=Desertibaculum subflavum TaxID=2268458 RepID=UPI0034D2B483
MLDLRLQALEYDGVIHNSERFRMPRTSRPITVTLGDLQERVDTRVQSGAYASASEVMRAALRALDREEAAIDEWMRRQIEESLNDPRPNTPATEVLARLRTHHARERKKRLTK